MVSTASAVNRSHPVFLLTMLGCIVGGTLARAASPERIDPLGRVITSVAGPASTVCSNPGEDGRPLPLPTLLAEGDRALALRMLHVARDCYGKALEQSPESYESRMGLGVVSLHRARGEQQAGRPAHGLIQEAKKHLGQAYLLRQDPYEPLYYLAEAALLEGKYKEAIAFLEPLLLVGWKEGPVYALLGELAERGAHGVPGCPPGKEQAICLYTKAFDVGWPESTYRYAGYRISGGHAARNAEPRRFLLAGRLGGGGDLGGNLGAKGLVAGVDLGIRLMKKRPLYLLLPMQAQFGEFTRIGVPLSLQYDFELPIQSLYLTTRIGGGYGYSQNSKDNGKESHGGVVWPEIGVKYTWADRVHLGANIGVPVWIVETPTPSLWVTLHVGANL